MLSPTAQQNFAEAVPTSPTKVTSPVSVTLALAPNVDPPTSAQIQEAVRNALSTDPSIVDVLATIVNDDGTVDVVFQTASQTEEDAASIQAELGSEKFLAALATQLGATGASSDEPTEAPTGTSWSPLATVQFGTPPDNVSEADFIQAALQALTSAAGLAVDVASLAPSADGSDGTDIVFSVLANDDDLAAILDEINSQEFREAIRDNLFDPSSLPDGTDAPTTNAIALDANTTPVQTIVLPGLAESAPTRTELEDAIQQATSGDVIADIIGLTTDDDGNLVVAFRTILPDDNASSAGDVADELQSSAWRDQLADQLGIDAVTNQLVDEPPPGSDYSTPARSQYLFIY